MDSGSIYDVAIIGAGPAGTSAAAVLEKQMDSVLLIEREKFPRIKVCAGVLPPRIYSEIMIPEEIRERSLMGYRVFSPSGKSVESGFPREGLIVRREVFDEFLAGKLSTKPVNDRITKIRIHTDFMELSGEKESYRAKAVIGADGVNSMVRKFLGIQPGMIASAVQYEISLPEPVIDERIGNWFEVYYVIPDGYAWISPLKNAVKIGMGGLSPDFKKDAKKHLDQFLRHVDGKIKGGNIERFEAWQIPMQGPLADLTGERTILAGDAGGFVYPGTGEGIYYGIKSGKVAGETIIHASEKGLFDQEFLGEAYSQKLEASGLLSLRDTTFIEEVLSSAKAAERYVDRLHMLRSLMAPL